MPQVVQVPEKSTLQFLVERRDVFGVEGQNLEQRSQFQRLLAGHMLGSV